MARITNGTRPRGEKRVEKYTIALMETFLFLRSNPTEIGIHRLLSTKKLSTSSAARALVAMGVVEELNGKARWVGGPPGTEMIDTWVKKISEIELTYKVKRKEKSSRDLEPGPEGQNQPQETREGIPGTEERLGNLEALVAANSAILNRLCQDLGVPSLILCTKGDS